MELVLSDFEHGRCLVGAHEEREAKVALGQRNRESGADAIALVERIDPDFGNVKVGLGTDGLSDLGAGGGVFVFFLGKFGAGHLESPGEPSQLTVGDCQQRDGQWFGDLLDNIVGRFSFRVCRGEDTAAARAGLPRLFGPKFTTTRAETDLKPRPAGKDPGI